MAYRLISLILAFICFAGSLENISGSLLLSTAKGEVWKIQNDDMHLFRGGVNRCMPPQCSTVWAKKSTDGLLVGIRTNHFLNRHTLLIYDIEAEKMVREVPFTWSNTLGSFTGTVCQDGDERLILIRHDYLNGPTGDRINELYFHWLDYNQVRDLKTKLFANYSSSQQNTGASTLDIRDCVVLGNSIITNLVLWGPPHDQTYLGAAILYSSDILKSVNFTTLPYSPQLKGKIPINLIENENDELLTFTSGMYSNKSQILALRRKGDVVTHQVWGPSDLGFRYNQMPALWTYCQGSMYAFPILSDAIWYTQNYSRITSTEYTRHQLSKKIQMPMSVSCIS